MTRFNLRSFEVDLFFLHLCKAILPGSLFFLGQIVVADAATHLVCGLVQHRKAHQIFIFNRLFQFVGKVRLAVLQLEGIVSALVFFAAWSCSQTDHQRIEIIEQCTVLLEDRAVRFVDDNQIKTTNAEFPGIIVHQIDHRLVGGEDHAGVDVAVQAAAGIQ